MAQQVRKSSENYKPSRRNSHTTDPNLLFLSDLGNDVRASKSDTPPSAKVGKRVKIQLDIDQESEVSP